MPVDFSALVVGNEYERPQLAELWGYESFHAIGKGIVTPKGQNAIVLFITSDQQPALPQYDNRFDGELLWMDGEQGHRTDSRLATSDGRDEVHLFYRDRDHSPFRYCGPMTLVEAFLQDGERPSRFVFTARQSLIKEAESALASDTNAMIEQSFVPETEGLRKARLQLVYERSRRNRSRALELHGHLCRVCGFDFDDTYGEDLAAAYIEVHHLRSLTTINGETVDPATDLAPLCANCHRMAHRRLGVIVSLEELRERIQRNRA
jgi:5-methylcytosine-specific restriction protein A